MVMDVSKALVKWLPDTLTVANGDQFSTSWYHGMVRHADATPPYGTFSPITTQLERERDFALYGSPEEITKNDTDTLTYSSSTDTYHVDLPDIDTVNSVTGTLNGASHTFVEDTDYEKVKESGYSTYSGIQWLSGGDSPDDGTNFTVDYDYRLLKLKQTMYERLSYRIGLHAKAFSSSESPASRAYNAVDLVQQLGDALTEYFAKNHGGELLTVADNTLRFKDYRTYGIMELEEGEATAVNVFDIRLSRAVNVVIGEVESIGKIDYTTTVE